MVSFSRPFFSLSLSLSPLPIPLPCSPHHPCQDHCLRLWRLTCVPGAQTRRGVGWVDSEEREPFSNPHLKGRAGSGPPADCHRVPVSTAEAREHRPLGTCSSVRDPHRAQLPYPYTTVSFPPTAVLPGLGDEALPLCAPLLPWYRRRGQHSHRARQACRPFHRDRGNSGAALPLC